MGTYAESLSLLSSSLLLSGSATGSVIDLLMGAILEAASSDGIITGAFGTVVLSLLLNSFERKGMTRGDCPDEIYSKPLLLSWPSSPCALPRMGYGILVRSQNSEGA